MAVKVTVTSRTKEVSTQFKKAVEKGLKKSALLVEGSAKMNAPNDKGNLIGSITHEASGEKATVFTNVEYAPYIEYGTGIYATEGGGRSTPWVYKRDDGKFAWTRGNPAQPFMEPALRDNKENIKKILSIALKQGVK